VKIKSKNLQFTVLIIILCMLLLTLAFTAGRAIFTKNDTNPRSILADRSLPEDSSVEGASSRLRSGEKEAGGSWSSYRRLGQELALFFRRIGDWGPQDSPSGSGIIPTRVREDEAFREVLSYRAEARERTRLLKETLERFQDELEQEVQARLKEKEKDLEKEVKAAIEDKRRMLEEKYAKYNREIQGEYLLELTNLRFKLELPGLPEEDIKSLEERISAVHEQMKEENQDKSGELEAELTAFAKRRASACDIELAKFERELVYQSKLRYEEEKSRLEKDFLAWQRRKEKELKEEGANLP